MIMMIDYQMFLGYQLLNEVHKWIDKEFSVLIRKWLQSVNDHDPPIRKRIKKISRTNPPTK